MRGLNLVATGLETPPGEGDSVLRKSSRERSCTTVCTRRKRGNVCWKEREGTAESRVYDGVPIGNVDNVEGESRGKRGKNTKGIGTVDTKEEESVG